MESIPKRFKQIEMKYDDDSSSDSEMSEGKDEYDDDEDKDEEQKAWIIQAVDWWVTEKPETAGLYLSDDGGPGDPAIFDMKLYIRNLRLPIARYSNRPDAVHRVEKTVTVRELIQIIYDFYQQPIRSEHRLTEKQLKNEELKEHPRRYLDMITRVPIQGRGSPGYPNKLFRNPYLCSGLIRLEGLMLMMGTLADYKVYLGS